MYVFAQNPDQWQKLQEDRSRIPAAVEELLRYEAPSQYNVRRNMRDVHLHGTTIPEGSPVFLIGGSANRDERAWTDPDTFDIDRDRTEATNLGLGYGIHSCLGAALARMESAVALEKLLDFMPRFEVDFDNCQRVQMQNVVGWKHVPVKVAEMTQKIEVDFGLCESNGVCMGIIPEVFDLDDQDYLHVLQDEVTPGERSSKSKEAVRQCPRQAISIRKTRIDRQVRKCSSSTRSPRSSSTGRGRSTGACARKRRCTTTRNTTSTRCRGTRTSRRPSRTSRRTRRRTVSTLRR